MKRRVVITGMGTVSPHGVGNAAFGEGILQGRSGVCHISRFDPAEIPVQIAGEVADSAQSAIEEQVAQGLAVRRALLVRALGVENA